MDSAIPPIRSNSSPRDVLDLGTVQVPISDDGGLMSRKFILTVIGIVIFGIFTALGKMDVDSYMYFYAAITAGYFGINFMQKKAL